MLVELYRGGRLPDVVRLRIEPRHGYVARLDYRDGGVRIARGNDYGVNPSSSAAIAADKEYAKFLLRTAELSVPQGDRVLLPYWRVRMGASGTDDPAAATRQEAMTIADRLGYPVWVKPAQGSMGVDVYKCVSPSEVSDAIDRIARTDARLAVIERHIPLPDHRVVVLDDEVVAAYGRRPAVVVGDGRATVRELIDRLVGASVDLLPHHPLGPRHVNRTLATLARSGLDPAAVPTDGRSVLVLDSANLSTGGGATDLTSTLAPRWRGVAVRAGHALGLRWFGVDLACRDLSSDEGDYAIIEINAAPGLEHFAALGPDQQRRAEDLVIRLLRAPLTPATGSGA